VKLSKDWDSHHRTKHVDIKYHYVKQASDNKIVSLTYIPRAAQVADLLTKSCRKADLLRHRQHLLSSQTSG
jgi:hypothetical protein